MLVAEQTHATSLTERYWDLRMPNAPELKQAVSNCRVTGSKADVHPTVAALRVSALLSRMPDDERIRASGQIAVEIGPHFSVEPGCLLATANPSMPA